MADEPEAPPPAPAAPASSPATPATTPTSISVPDFVTDWRSIRDIESKRPHIIEKKK
jgi:hypothetical protein